MPHIRVLLMTVNDSPHSKSKARRRDKFCSFLGIYRQPRTNIQISITYRIEERVTDSISTNSTVKTGASAHRLWSASCFVNSLVHQRPWAAIRHSTSYFLGAAMKLNGNIISASRASQNSLHCMASFDVHGFPVSLYKVLRLAGLIFEPSCLGGGGDKNSKEPTAISAVDSV